MKETFKTILKVIGWIVVTVLTVITYTVTFQASAILEETYSWAPLFSLGIVFIYPIGIALRDKLGGLTLAMVIASVVAFIISTYVMACVA